ncbi:hematopoietic SH2 domain-containing protein homolog [Nelusetta ayraudi]|uniref:hematopoietic SH2 domain-containing protein homolog n=1 Tax=Nelusetta ayraudi TaxID=303726 RepID=UPI003F711413
MDWNQSLQGQRAALHWFTESHLQSVIRNGSIPEWFHGIISRKAAEVLLMSKPPGYFLIRVSESRIGYTLSYRAEDRCRHFMIDASDDGQCVIVGEDRRHRCLHDLVEFHQRAPIVPFNEVLTVACGQTSNEGSDYADLLFPQRQSNHQASLQPLDSSHQGLTHQSSQEDAPPALPYLPSSLNTFAAVTPVSQPHRLYPGLPEYPPATTSVTASDVPPVPKTRRKYKVDDSSSSQPLQAPTWHFGLQQKPNQASVSTVESPSSPTVPKDPTGANNTEHVKNQEAKPSLVSKILQKKFPIRASSLQEFFNPDGSNKTENVQTFDHPHFSCKELPSGGKPLEYRMPPPFAPGYS